MTEEGAALTAAEAATLAAVSVRTVRNWIAEGLLPATPSRRGRLIQRADLLALMGQKGLGSSTIVEPTEGTAATTEDAEEVAASTAATTDPLAALVLQLHEENLRLAGQVGYLQRQVVEYQERILLLSSGVAEATTAPVRAQHAPQEAPTASEVAPQQETPNAARTGRWAALGRWWRGKP